MDSTPRVVVVGAGFGGLAAARALRDSPVEVTVVDQRNHHTFQPLLYQVATAGLDADDICYATRGIFRRQSNANAVQARVVGIDFEARRVETEPGPPLPYDHLVLALGAVTDDFGVPGVTEHAFGLKNAAEATALRSHVLRCFERAERHPDPAESAALTTVVVVGGGPTGVEMAGGFAELFHRVLRTDFPGVDVDRSAIVLVEGQSSLLSTFKPSLGAKARDRLAGMGVDVRLESLVSFVDEAGVGLADGTLIRAATVVWAAGVRANPMAAELGLSTDSRGRVEVDRNLRLTDRPEVYVIGDLAAATDGDGMPLPQVAAVAIQGGKHVAEAIGDELDGKPTAPFRYFDKGSMATIGRNAAVVELPPGITITGFLGWVAWLVLHLVMLIGFRNRANVLVNWAWNYLTYDRGSRLILEPDLP